MQLEEKMEEEKQVQMRMFAAWVFAENLPARREWMGGGREPFGPYGTLFTSFTFHVEEDM